MGSAVCDGLTELLETVDEDAELLDDEVSPAGVVTVVWEVPELLEVADDPPVTVALVLMLVELADDEPVVEDLPVVPLVVVVPPAEVVVVEPVLPPLEDTEVVGEV